jgi:hypothetical protein
MCVERFLISIYNGPGCRFTRSSHGEISTRQALCATGRQLLSYLFPIKSIMLSHSGLPQNWKTQKWIFILSFTYRLKGDEIEMFRHENLYKIVRDLGINLARDEWPKTSFYSAISSHVLFLWMMLSVSFLNCSYQ